MRIGQELRVHRIIGPKQMRDEDVHSIAKKELADIGDIRIEDYKIDQNNRDLFRKDQELDFSNHFQPVTVVLVYYRVH